jgi:putative endonuclease
MRRTFYIYIITNTYNSVIYVGVTNDLYRRITEHKNKNDKNSFSAKYNLWKLVYYEYTEYVHSALDREKEIKKWRRDKKNKLIEMMNPEWNDLFAEIDECGGDFSRPIRNDKP